MINSISTSCNRVINFFRLDHLPRQTLSKTCYIALAIILALGTSIAFGWFLSSSLLPIPLILSASVFVYAGWKLGKTDREASISNDTNSTSLASKNQLTPALIEQQTRKRKVEKMTQEIIRLENLLLKLREQGLTEEANDTWEEIQTKNQQIQSLYREGDCGLTSYDLLSIKKIFESPVNEYYTDSDGTLYYAPDSSALIKTIACYQNYCGYAGYGRTAPKKEINPQTGEECLCDVLYLKKKEDQIAYETGIQSIFERWFSPDIKERIARQEKIASNIILPLVRENYSRWGYSGYHLCSDPSKLENLQKTFGKENLQKSHMALLFYQKVEPNSV